MSFTTRMCDVVMLSDVRAGDVARLGGKAANLGELIAAGFPVPAGFCVPASAYRATAWPIATSRLDGLAAQLDDGASDERLEPRARMIRAAIEHAELPAGLLAELEHAYWLLRRDHDSVAVRSSVTANDPAIAGAAGRYHTELDVRSFDELQRAIKRCWASLWQVRAIRSRHRRRLPHGEAGMAVVVQGMVHPEVSGVMFTVDPMPSASRALVIEASWGCGEAVAGGLVQPDRFEVSRADLTVAHVEISSQDQRVACATGGAAVREIARQPAASLTDAQASALARTGLAIEARFRGPQDVEWAISGDRIVILQTRPITRSSAGSEVRWDSPVPGARWARISLCDAWLPTPLSPLFATTLFPALVKGWLERWAGHDAAEGQDPLLPAPMSATIHGYAYLRVDLPLNQYPLRTLKLIANALRHHLGGLERRWRTEVCPRHVARIAALRRLDLTRQSSAEILRVIAELQELSGIYWGLMAGLSWYWRAGAWLLGHLVRRLTGSEAPAARGAGALLEGWRTGAPEAEAEAEIKAKLELYRLAKDTDGQPMEFARRFQAFLETYGHQVGNLDFVEPTPAEDPSALLATLEAYREGRAGDPREQVRALAERREALSARVATALRRSPVKRRLYRAISRWNQHYGPLRDQVRFSFTLGWPVLRRSYLELGRRLVVSGALERADDVFFLTGQELERELQAIAAGRAPRRRTEAVRERRALREAQKLVRPPEQVPEPGRLVLGGVDLTSLALVRRLVGSRTGRTGSLLPCSRRRSSPNRC